MITRRHLRSGAVPSATEQPRRRSANPYIDRSGSFIVSIVHVLGLIATGYGIASCCSIRSAVRLSSVTSGGGSVGTSAHWPSTSVSPKRRVDGMQRLAWTEMVTMAKRALFNPQQITSHQLGFLFQQRLGKNRRFFPSRFDETRRHRRGIHADFLRIRATRPSVPREVAGLKLNRWRRRRSAAQSPASRGHQDPCKKRAFMRSSSRCLTKQSQRFPRFTVGS